MTQSVSIGSHLPYLRRFARALTGSQRAGDAYAIATLEAIAKGWAGTKPMTRQSLFRIFLENLAFHHHQTGAAATAPDGHLMRAADRTLEALTPLPRVAFLLRALEGFSTAEAAEILDISQAKVQDLLDAAGREIAAQLRTDVLIIEDEPIIAMDSGSHGHRPLAIPCCISPIRTRRPSAARSRAVPPALCWRTSNWPTAAPASTR